MTDVELEVMDAQQRKRFSDEIKARHPSQTPLSNESAEWLVGEAMTAIGVKPHRDWWTH
jgi:hypothetical protein